MATISIDIPNAVATRVADAFIATYQPPAGTPVGTGAEKLAYVKALLIAHVRQVVKAREATVAGNAARVAAGNSADAEILPT